MALKYKLPLFCLTAKAESHKRQFGYGVEYQNVAEPPETGRHLITAIDRTGYKHLDAFPDGTMIVIHDPTEVIGTRAAELVEHLPRFKIITIRKSVQRLLKERFGLASKFLIHPFYAYPFKRAAAPSRAVSVSRLDYDKHIDIILRANKMLPAAKQVDIYGAVNRLYVYKELGGLGLKKHYKGQMERSFEALAEALTDAKYVVDMSYYKHDGGGSQYTFLEAIYAGAALVLHSKWVEDYETEFVDGKNCFVVDGPEDLAELLGAAPATRGVATAARRLLEPHLRVDWPRSLAKY